MKRNHVCLNPPVVQVLFCVAGTACTVSRLHTLCAEVSGIRLEVTPDWPWLLTHFHDA